MSVALPEEEVVSLEELDSESEEEPVEVTAEDIMSSPEIHNSGFVVFANSPDTSRFQFASNLKNFGNMEISFSSFDSRHPDQNKSFHKEFKFGKEV